MSKANCEELPDGFKLIKIYALHFINGGDDNPHPGNPWFKNHSPVELTADQETITCYLATHIAAEGESFTPTFDGNSFKCGGKSWRCDYVESVPEDSEWQILTANKSK